ncbi:50S ribosomal protein L11 methyltransferase [Halorhodospira abdelmalekii]|uniref:50S ribosomal protein L11 methyltransferase n=1 Tax=Halorhodospira abdelmalekii TaxID=421629 RepID=UPI0019076E1F|nr:50S ribosomal protein L11 methyltransferase [Halorhodospira abdelmalekii]MBK1734325.1 50S ribosomal protein L11 methyltransferase [Halorhodospira abdelmalekii]
MAQLQIELIVDATELDAVDTVLTELGAWSQTYQGEDGSVLLEPGVGEHPLWGRVRVTALFSAQCDAALLHAQLLRALGQAQLSGWRAEPLADRAWEREWLSHFRPLSFGRRLWIVPSGARPELPEEAVAIHLDPGLAFGTGTHETTALCLEWLDGEPLSGRRGIDFGAGSGVLAIAAVCLGARECLAVDNDPQAVQATRANAARNGVAAQVPTCLAAERPSGCADFLVANILSATLRALANELLATLPVGGRLALSGILEGQQHEVMSAFATAVAWEAPRRRGDWVLLSGTRCA